MNKSELIIKADSKIVLENNLITTLKVNINEELNLDIITLDNSSGTLFMNIFGYGHLKLNLHFGMYSNWNYLYLNESDEMLEVDEEVVLEQSAEVKANYGELTNGNHSKQTSFNMIGRKGHLEVRGASLVFNKLRWIFAVNHKAVACA